MAAPLTRAQLRWQQDQDLVLAAEPGLHLFIDELAGQAHLAGTVRLRMPGGRVRGFELLIEYPSADPFALPDTYDPVGRFLLDDKRHIEHDGRFCLWLPHCAPRREFAGPGGLALYLFRVQEFLALQLMYETRSARGVHPFWPGPAWSHGGHGYVEWAREQAAGLSADQFQALLTKVYARGQSGRRCPCGSSKRLGNCHKKWLKTMRDAWADPSARAGSYQVLKEKRELACDSQDEALSPATRSAGSGSVRPRLRLEGSRRPGGVDGKG